MFEALFGEESGGEARAVGVHRGELPWPTRRRERDQGGQGARDRKSDADSYS